MLGVGSLGDGWLIGGGMAWFPRACPGETGGALIAHAPLEGDTCPTLRASNPLDPCRLPVLTAPPNWSTQDACVCSPKPTETPSASSKVRASPAGWSRSPPSAAALTPSTCPAPRSPATPRPAKCFPPTRRPVNPANGWLYGAATAAPPSAHPAHVCTPERPGRPSPANGRRGPAGSSRPAVHRPVRR